MKQRFTIALLTGCLCASFICPAQHSEKLLDENFDDNQFDTRVLRIMLLDELQIVTDLGGQGKHLEIGPPHYSDFLHPYHNNLMYQDDKALAYDSLEATFVFNPDLTGSSSVYYGNGHYKIGVTSGHGLYYKDESLGKEFMRDFFIVNSLDIRPGDAKWVQYNPDTKSFRMKWGKQLGHNLLDHTREIKFYNTACPDDITDFVRLQDCFCNTTSNPADCKQKVSPPPPFPLLKYAIDNLVITGFSPTATGIDDPAETSFREKQIVKSVDLMGREILDLANYKGPAIVMFSDGSREKRLF